MKIRIPRIIVLSSALVSGLMKGEDSMAKETSKKVLDGISTVPSHPLLGDEASTILSSSSSSSSLLLLVKKDDIRENALTPVCHDVDGNFIPCNDIETAKPTSRPTRKPKANPTNRPTGQCPKKICSGQITHNDMNVVKDLHGEKCSAVNAPKYCADQAMDKAKVKCHGSFKKKCPCKGSFTQFVNKWKKSGVNGDCYIM